MCFCGNWWVLFFHIYRKCKMVFSLILFKVYTTLYRNFCCKNIFVHRKRTKIFYTSIILQRKIFQRWLAPCYTPALHEVLLPYILVYMASNTTSNLLLPAISSACGAISSINAHHTRLVKLFSFNLVCPKIILREYFFCTRRKKANYGMLY